MAHVKKEMLSFFLTTKCNLACRYCYTNKEKEKHKDQTIPFEFAKLGIDYFIYEYPHIRFFGAGEPTQEFNLMKKIRNYAYDKVGNKLKLELQTNGVFPETVRGWLAKHADIIWVSFDGLPDVQDYYRPLKRTGKPSSPFIEKNVKYLRNYGRGMTGVRVTITNKNIRQQKEMVDYFAKLGVKHIWTDPLFHSVGDKPISENVNAETVKPLIDIEKYVDEFIQAQRYAKIKKIFYGSFLACNFDEETQYHCRACIPVPHLTTDGYISACDMALYGEDNNHMNLFIYGKWDEKNNKLAFFKERICYLQSRSVHSIKNCKDCPVKLNCGGYCLGEVVNETGNLFGNKKYVCRSIIKLACKTETNFGCYEYLHP